MRESTQAWTTVVAVEMERTRDKFLRQEQQDLLMWVGGRGERGSKTTPGFWLKS